MNEMPETSTNQEENEEEIEVSFTYGGKKYTKTLPRDMKIVDLKPVVQEFTGILPANQKLMFQGLLKDHCSLRECNIKPGHPVMIMGSTVDQIKSVQKTSADVTKLVETENTTPTEKVPLSKQLPHSKTIDKGVPADAMPAICNINDALPIQPLTGMVNKHGKKVRLTFKLELDEVWIGSNERTDKIPISQIKDVLSEPIEGHPGYHMLGLQIGPTEASRYWFYWVPSQFIQAIKRALQ